MAEKNANEMPSGQNDEKILVLEEMPSKGKTVGRTTVLTDSVRDLIKSGKKNGETYNMELSEDGALPTQSKKGKVKLLDVRQNDNPLTAFIRNLTAHLDAMDTKGDLKSIYVVSANIYRLNSLSNCRIDSSPKLIQLSRTMSFSVQKLREEERLINDGMMTDSTKIDWKKLENDFGVKADWLTRKGQVDTPLHIQQSDAVKAARPLIGKYNDQWLRTEYNTAILRARSAVQYRDALRTKALYPSLEYLKSHPYTRGQGDPNCPECRRQGLVKSSDLLNLPGDRLCPMHAAAMKIVRRIDKFVSFDEMKSRLLKSRKPENYETTLKLREPLVLEGHKYSKTRVVDRQLLHATRDTKRLAGKTLSLEELMARFETDLTSFDEWRIDERNSSIISAVKYSADKRCALKYVFRLAVDQKDGSYLLDFVTTGIVDRRNILQCEKIK